MRWAAFVILAASLGLQACAPLPLPSAPPEDPAIRAEAERAALNFLAVVERVEPVLEAECRALTRGVPCDFTIVIDDRRGLPPNAFQTVDNRGRPIVGFTLSLIAEARNQDELAFILGHEAGHHIAGHLAKTQAAAEAGALISGTLARLGGADDATIRAAVEAGAELGARRYSQEFELEADALGARLAAAAGYDPVRGAQYFNRIPDPGNVFLGTHPPNAQRIELVRQVAASL